MSGIWKGLMNIFLGKPIQHLGRNGSDGEYHELNNFKGETVCVLYHNLKSDDYCFTYSKYSCFNSCMFCLDHEF